MGCCSPTSPRSQPPWVATAEKALEAAGGAGYFRRHGLERLLRDVHGGQFHPLPEKRQQRFTGRMAMGLEPVG